MASEKGLRLKIVNGVNNKVATTCKEFSKWLRKKYEFPIRLNVYIKPDSEIITSKGEKASALFFQPYSKDIPPHIKISTGDFYDMKSSNGEFNALMAILGSFAHEIVHYNQFLEKRKYSEMEAKRKSVEIVEEYSESKDGMIFYNSKVVRLLKKTSKYIDQKDYYKALNCYKKIENNDPLLYEIYFEEADVYVNLSMYDEAIQSLDKAICLNENDSKLYNEKGYVLDLLGRNNEAIALYDLAINIDPDESIFYSNKGYSLSRLSMYDEAINSYNKAISLSPKTDFIYVFKAQALEMILKYDEAIECYRKAIKINPYYDIAHNGIGWIYYLLGKYNMALKSYNKAIDISPDYAEAYYNKAICYAKMNCCNEVISNLKKAIDLNAEYIGHIKNEGYLKEYKDLNF